MRLLRGLLLFPLLGMLLVGSSACSGSRRAPVSGTVTVQGKPYTPGGLVISFLGQDGRPVTAEVDTDGKYMASGVLIGEVAVGVYHAATETSVASDPLEVYRNKSELSDEDVKKIDKLKREQEKNPPAARSPIPLRYRDPATSNLKTVIEAGQNTYHVDLKKS